MTTDIDTRQTVRVDLGARAYDIVRMMTDGGPANRTELIWTYVTRLAIDFDPRHKRDPLISGNLKFRYREYTIGVGIPTVRLSDIDAKDVTMSSQPPGLTPEQIRAILLIGVPTVDSSEDAQNLVVASIAMAGLDILAQTLFPGEGGVVSDILDRLTIVASSGDTLADSTVRAEFRIFNWLNIYGAREGNDSYHGGIGLKMSLPRTPPKRPGAAPPAAAARRAGDR